MVMNYSCVKVLGQQSVSFEDRLETNIQTDRWTDAIAVPLLLIQSVKMFRWLIWKIAINYLVICMCQYSIVAVNTVPVSDNFSGFSWWTCINHIPLCPWIVKYKNNFFHVFRRVKKCTEYEVGGSRPRGRPKRTWLQVVQKDCQTRKLSRDGAMVCGRWRKLIKDGWCAGKMWVCECFLWYHLTWVVLDKKP